MTTIATSKQTDFTKSLPYQNPLPYLTSDFTKISGLFRTFQTYTFAIKADFENVDFNPNNKQNNIYMKLILSLITT